MVYEKLNVKMDSLNSMLIYDLFCTKICLCKLCDKYLTVSPIYELADIGYVCGRCTSKIKYYWNLRDSDYKPQTLAEELLKDRNVPCGYKIYGCDAVLKWNSNVMQHENGCDYKEETCPLVYDDVGEEDCTWSGNCMQFEEHVEEKHKSLITTDGELDVTLSETGEKSLVYFLKCHSTIFTIVCKYVAKTEYYIFVFCNATKCKYYRTELRLVEKVDANPEILVENELIPLHSFEEYFLENKNMSKIVFDGGVQGVIKIKINPVKDENCSWEVALLDTPKKTPPILDIKKKWDNNMVLVEKCLCSICSSYIVTDENCTGFKGYFICSNCTSLINADHPLFKQNVQENAALPSITSGTMLPCRRKKCKFSCVGKFIRVHEAVCQFAKTDCVVDNCDAVMLRQDLGQHLQQTHKNVLIHEDKLLSLNMEIFDQKWKSDFIYFDNNVFRLSRKNGLASTTIDGKPCIPVDYRNIEFIVSCENDVGETKYNYLLEFFNSDHTNLFSTLTGTCEYYVIDQLNDYCNKCVLTLNGVEECLETIANKELLYKIHIFKV